MKRFCQGALFLALLGCGFARGDEERMPPPPYPPDTLADHQQGKVVISVLFSSSGSVADCHAINTTATKEVVAGTLRWIKNKWHSRIYAGKRVNIPIFYIPQKRFIEPAPRAPSPFQPGFTSDWQIDWYRQFADGKSQWARDFVPPPFAYIRDEVLIVSVAFDASGFVKADSVIQSTGDAKYDSFALSWIKSYWYHSDYAGHTAQMSIFFNRGPYGFYVQRSG